MNSPLRTTYVYLTHYNGLNGPCIIVVLYDNICFELFSGVGEVVQPLRCVPGQE